MASVNSPIRNFIKPALFKIVPNFIYKEIQAYAKYRDITHRLVEEPEMEVLPKLIKISSEVIDIGANYAYYSERLSRLVGNKGKVFGFEPIPFTYEVALKVIRKLNIKNIFLFQKGVGEKNEKTTFRIPKQDFGAISAGLSHISRRNNEFKEKNEYYKFSQEELAECEIIALDDFILEKLSDLSFIKIDIEGAEYYALKGMQKTLKKFKPVILVEIQYFFMEGFGLKIDELINLIRLELEYSIFCYDTKDKKLHPFNGPVWHGNYILIHKTELQKFNHLF